jgi:aryl-alcohol dehydrogenase-like predicted oxidoreductase
LFAPDNYNRIQQAIEKLRPIAARKSISLGQLALAWVIAQPLACAIAGARNADQVVQNAIAAEIQLTADELSEMDTIGRTVTDHLDDNPIMWDF